ncbi:MAG: phosphoglucosamine mutase, partial [Azonexus sp.]
PNGLNINDGFGATSPKALCEAVLAHGADLGVALDGDADRLQMVDARGQLYDGDQLLYAIVRSRASHGRVKGVVGTLMTNLALEHALAKMDVPFARAAVGDRYVVEMLHDRGWLFGGENSGHILTLDRHTTGDGTVAALQVLAALRESGGDLESLLGGLHLYPQKLINVPIVKGFPWQDDTSIQGALAAVEGRMSGRGRVLLRASGTEPLLRVMVEGEDAREVLAAAEDLATVVREAAN